MGTHPIFESDFDCLTDCFAAIYPRKSKKRKMGNKKGSKKVKKEAGIQPAAKRQRVSFDDDDVRIVDIVRAEPIELDDSNDSANSDQQARNMSDDEVNVVFDDIPGPSHAFHFGQNDENTEVKAFAQTNREFTQRRQEIMANLQSSLTEMEDDYNQIAKLTETLHRDHKTKTKVKQESDELAAEIALKSAQKDILDKNLEEVSKRIETNEKTLESAQNRIKSFEVTYKKEEEGANQEEAAGKVGEYECPICKEICGNEQKHMVCITSCGHRFCKDCIDRVLAPQDHDALAGRLGRRGARFLRMRERILEEQRLGVQAARPFARRPNGADEALPDRVHHMGIRRADDPPAAGENAADAALPLERRLDEFWIPPERPIPVVRANEDGQWPPFPLPWDRRVRGDVQRRCPTCQKQFSKKHVIRLY